MIYHYYLLYLIKLQLIFRSKTKEREEERMSYIIIDKKRAKNFDKNTTQQI